MSQPALSPSSDPAALTGNPPFDAFLLVSFGGPEGPEDVIPFLENVLRGKNVPRERMLAVAEHYQHFGGVSPINEQNRQLLAALKQEFSQNNLNLPIYWGNRNWAPFLPDALRQMQADGVKNALAFFTSTFSSYSGCRQYRENIVAAREQVDPAAPAVAKIRVFYNHPGFIEAMVDRVRDAISQLPPELRGAPRFVFTAHSIPNSMAGNCGYEKQLAEACRLVAERVNSLDWKLAYQSRSGPPTQPWLEPDIGDYLRETAAADKSRAVVCVPIGFISDHMEVLYDLDHEAAHIAAEAGLTFVRAGTVGVHPRFVRMIRELVEERQNPAAERVALGAFGPSHDVCPVDCCLYTPQRPPR